jgi:hypothetical protein
MNSAHRVCLVGHGHVASNPRLVKEADALQAAGFRARVVAVDYMDAIRPLDRTILAAARWPARIVNRGSRAGKLIRAVRRRACQWLTEHGVGGAAIAATAESDLIGQMVRAATREPTDLFIGHSLPGLVAAAKAARIQGVRLGFDAEDSHVDELPELPKWSGQRSARESIERVLLPRCRHLTAAAPMIADAYRRRYGVEAVSVLNVFPLREAPETPCDPPSLSSQGPPTLYWFSQTLGPGRGLESVLTALGRMRTPAELHLRGYPSTGYVTRLRALADQLGVRDRLVLHKVAEPGRMAHLSAPHDLGLALELNEPPNRAICLTNKAFTYLLAGVPVLLSATPAQRELGRELGLAALVADITEPTVVASVLDAWFADTERQRAARREAWRLGRVRYNWDMEQQVFLQSVRRALETPV